MKMQIGNVTVNATERIIHLDRSKFTDDEWNELEEYRQLAIRLKVLQKLLYVSFDNADGKREKNQWWKCVEKLDELVSHYDDLLFYQFQQLPNDAVHIFY